MVSPENGAIHSYCTSFLKLLGFLVVSNYLRMCVQTCDPLQDNSDFRPFLSRFLSASSSIASQRTDATLPQSDFRYVNLGVRHLPQWCLQLRLQTVGIWTQNPSAESLDYSLSFCKSKGVWDVDVCPEAEGPRPPLAPMLYLQGVVLICAPWSWVILKYNIQ